MREISDVHHSQRNNLKICSCVSKLKELYALCHAFEKIVREVPLHTNLVYWYLVVPSSSMHYAT